MAEERIGDGRHVSGSTTGVIVGYIRRQAGDDGVTRLLELAGEERSPAELEDTTSWSSYDAVVALFDAAATLTGDQDVARRIGEELLLQHAGTEVAALLRSLGSPGELLRNVAETAAKYSTVTSMEALAVGDTHAVITAKAVPGIVRHRHFCRYTAGVLSQASPLFGFEPAQVEEVECETRGDDRCVYRVSWDESGDGEADPARRVAMLESQLAALTSRFESLQATAAALVAGESVDEVLATVTRRAGLAVRAPQFLLAAQLAWDEEPRVHHVGFDDETAARERALVLLRDRAGRGDGELVVDVASRRHRYGVLAALYPGGSRFFPQERQLLAAYAGHAAAVLDTATALEEARRENRTSQALLSLARSLAEVGTSAEVAERLAGAVLDVVDCVGAGVFLWDEERQVARLVASAGLDAQRATLLDGFEVSPGASSGLGGMLERPAPVLVDASNADPVQQEILRFAGVETAAVVPIAARTRFLGVVAVGFASGQAARHLERDLVDRLAGMADHAATALQNARLLEEIQRQAVHDNLTGLANGLLFRDRVAAAIAQARRDDLLAGLLFVDLDRFKPVNDTFGHAAGDEVLRECARRIRAELRAADSAARLGGDEFAILLPRLDAPEGAAAAAERVVFALEQPFDVQGQQVFVSCSVGISLFPDDGDSFETLVRHADAAMYEAKGRRRGTYRFASRTS